VRAMSRHFEKGPGILDCLCPSQDSTVTLGIFFGVFQEPASFTSSPSTRIAEKTLDVPTLCRVPDCADSNAFAINPVQDDVWGAPDD